MSYCIALEADISTDFCPLPPGNCYWSHTRTQKCCYTESDLTQEEFCELTGRTLPTEGEKQIFLTDLRAALKGK
jgi:hypothetical protein